MAKLAYFTMDDSPSAYFKEKVDLLAEKNIPTLFFSIGELMEKKPDDMIYAIQKGFVIGNHGYTHTRFCDLGIEEGINEITKTDNIISELYKKAKVKRTKKYFRYPHGIKGNIRFGSKKIFLRRFDKKFMALDKHLKELGYEPLKIKNYKKRMPRGFMNDTDTYWTGNIGEFLMITKNRKFYEIENRIDAFFSYKNGNEILLVHDNDETHQYFDKIMDQLIDKGFTFLDIE
jgi:peptidoglycan/xylan/chitin deacetylase (PgdA/CDA1 family)